MSYRRTQSETCVVVETTASGEMVSGRRR